MTHQQATEMSSRVRPLARLTCRVLFWSYLAVLLLVWALIHFGGDRYWLPTVMMFGPRWPYAAPFPFFLLLAIWMNRIERTALVAIALILLFPVMRFCVPWERLSERHPTSIRIVTCNVAGKDADHELLADFIRQTDPDIAAFQECSEEVASFVPAGWNVLRTGDMAIASRFPIRSLKIIKREHPPTRWPRPICHVVEVTLPERKFQIATLHLQSPRYGLAEVTDARTLIRPSRRHELIEQTAHRRAESRQVSQELTTDGGMDFVVGDFNMTVDSTIYRECWSKYRNAFSRAGLGFGHTVAIFEGSYRFTARIDQILASHDWTINACQVGPPFGADHRPLVAELSRD